jgi:hypothetical protein
LWFDRVAGEFADLRAIAFYCAAVIVALLATGCSARLAAARLPLFIRATSLPLLLCSLRR